MIQFGENKNLLIYVKGLMKTKNIEVIFCLREEFKKMLKKNVEVVKKSLKKNC
jgi:hypothetical protein